MRRWHDHNCEGRESTEIDRRSDIKNRTWCANDGARPRNASNLFADRGISARAFASAGCISRTADDCTKYAEAFGLRPNRIAETLTAVRTTVNPRFGLQDSEHCGENNQHERQENIESRKHGNRQWMLPGCAVTDAQCQ